MKPRTTCQFTRAPVGSLHAQEHDGVALVATTQKVRRLSGDSEPLSNHLCWKLHPLRSFFRHGAEARVLLEGLSSKKEKKDAQKSPTYASPCFLLLFFSVPVPACPFSSKDCHSTVRNVHGLDVAMSDTAGMDPFHRPQHPQPARLQAAEKKRRRPPGGSWPKGLFLCLDVASKNTRRHSCLCNKIGKKTSQ